MNLEQLINEDRIRKVSAGFYEEIQTWVKERTEMKRINRIFVRRHLWMSLAAGILLGLLINGIQKYRFEHDRSAVLKEWMDNHYMNDIEIEQSDYYFL
ncbi:hypothetical protein [Odoribacter laneus]|uniref:hypothetical protein n=1 Tax=Odoribacter laneus TaxID=626933 RepID=UPI0039911746